MDRPQSLDELNEGMAVRLTPILQQLDPQDAWVIIDQMKEAMELYCQLVEEGKITPDQRYKQDKQKAVDFANEMMEEHGAGEV